MNDQNKIARDSKEDHMRYAKRLLTVAVALIGMVAVTDLSLHAQTSALKVSIPFAFQAGQKTLPAGTYLVLKQGEAIWFSDGKGNAAAVLANAIPNKAVGLDNVVVFHRYGDQHFLSEVRWSESSTARGVPETKAEHRLASATSSESVKLAAIPR
jgi:hypothetical protein